MHKKLISHFLLPQHNGGRLLKLPSGGCRKLGCGQQYGDQLPGAFVQACLVPQVPQHQFWCQRQIMSNNFFNCHCDILPELLNGVTSNVDENQMFHTTPGFELSKTIVHDICVLQHYRIMLCFKIYWETLVATLLDLHLPCLQACRNIKQRPLS